MKRTGLVLYPLGVGNIRVYPADAGVPNVSTVNFRPGQNTANSAIVVLASNGAMTALASFADTDLVVDVNGYFGGSLQTRHWMERHHSRACFLDSCKLRQLEISVCSYELSTGLYLR